MVEVIREKAISFTSSSFVNGVFVFKKHNVQNQEVPQLPILYGTQENNQFWIYSESGDEIEVFSKELNFHFTQGDILEINYQKKTIKGVLSSLNNENTLLLTEQCENRCLFCSQPPNDLPDIHFYKKAIMAILNYNSESLIGLTGGEPTINSDAFIGLMVALNNFNNTTPLHILSNGRNLGNTNFFEKVIEQTSKRNIIWGIPLYGHKSSLHDIIVGAKDAFSDTLSGLLHLSSSSNTIELRIVMVKQNYKFLPNILEFIDSTFPAITMISIMKLEPMGWARKNYYELYISVDEQNKYLNDAISSFNMSRFDIKLLNYPLCLLHERLRQYAVKSISDWKNYYPDECAKCPEKDNCCGYFSSSTKDYFETPKVIL